MIAIRPFQPADAPAVSALNRAWLVASELLEPADEHFLIDPAADILATGGAIFVATHGAACVGTVAVHPVAPGVWELVKLAVDPRTQGQGLGRRLVETALAHARAEQAERVILVSASRLVSAVRLYERLGFQHRPLPVDVPYATADVYMELALRPSR